MFCTQFFRASLVQTAVNVADFFKVSRYIRSGQAHNSTLLFSLKCRFNIIIFQETCHALVCAMLTSKTNQFTYKKSTGRPLHKMCFSTIFPSSCQFTSTTIKSVFFALYIISIITIIAYPLCPLNSLKALRVSTSNT